GDFDGDNVQNFLVTERLNLAVLAQAFPFHNSDPLDLDPYDGEIAQVELPFGYAGRVSIVPGAGEQLEVTYYARAHDDDYDPWNNPEYVGHSLTRSVDIALNQRPLIFTLTDNREAISGGDQLTLTANGVEDLDGGIVRVEFYRDDGDGLFDAEADGIYIRHEDLWIQPLLNPGAGEPTSGDPGTTGLLFFDENDNAQWDVGEEIWDDSTGTLPGYYDATDLPVYAGTNTPVWDTALGTPGIEGNVLFYDAGSDGYDHGTDPVWAEQVDRLLGVDTDGSDGWSFTGPFAGDTSRIYYAVAVDNDGAGSLPARTLVNQRPTIAALYVDGVYNDQNDSVILNGVPPLANSDEGIRGDVIFSDADYNGRWDTDEDLWHEGSGGGDADNGVYDWEYQVYAGANAPIWDTLGGTAGTQGTALFNDLNGDGRFNWTEDAWLDAGILGEYDAPDTPIWDGGGLWTTDVGTAGDVGNLWVSTSPTDEVWADASIDDDGVYHDIQEAQIYADPVAGWTTEDGAQGIQGNVLFRDDNSSDGWDTNEPIWADEVFEHQDIVLTAVDVQAGENSGGTLVRKVHFYRDSNYNGEFDPYTDQWLGRGVNVGNVRGGAADDWRFFVREADWVESPYWDTFIDTVNWPPGTQSFFAVAQDTSDHWSSEINATSSGNVRNIPPIIISLDGDPEPVTEGGQLTLTAIGVDDPYGQVDYVAFYRDLNGDTVFDPQELLGVDSNGADGWTWTAQVTWPAGEHTYMARVLDNYGDWSHENATLVTFTGNVNTRPVFGGTFEPATTIGLPAALPVAVVSADLDGNDLPDLVVIHAGGTLSVLLGNGDGTFSAATYTIGNAPETVLVYNLNPGTDAFLDLVVTNSGSNNVSVLMGEVDGTFQAATAYPAGTNPVGLALGDYDKDGNVDLAVTNQSANDVSILLGDGTGAFGAPTAQSLTLLGPVGVVTGDFNGDSKLDLAVAESGAARVAILFGDGLGAFSASSTVTAGTTPESLLMGDFNEDGDLDLAVANSGSHDVSLLLGDGEGTFTDSANSPFSVTAGAPSFVTAGLLDADNRTDLVVTRDVSNKVSVLRSNGQGNFGAHVDYDVGTTPVGIAVADFNLDGTQDLIVANNGSGNLSLLTGIPSLMDDVDPVDQGETLTLTATGLRDADGDAIVSVEFYRDANQNGALDLGLDQQLDPDGVTYLGEFNGGRSYQWQGTVDWAVGDHIYFARAQDDRDDVNTVIDEGGWSYAVSESGRVTNPGPIIVGGLEDQPDPVTEGYYLTLVAKNVFDSNGVAERVEFYLDDGTSSFDENNDYLLGFNDTAVGADFSLQVFVDDQDPIWAPRWTPGTHMYFARAQDDLGVWSESVSAVGYVNGRPVVTAVTASPNPVPYGDDLTLTATGVADVGGAVVEVEFYRDTNKNGVYNEGADELLIGDGVVYDSLSDSWSITFAAVTDTTIFFARAKDGMDGWSYATASPPVNRRPVVSGLTDTP
ncbi:MAG: VCBS repeat-containing protein, partial [Candidatus Brocadiae bacterium]|nr:VCBS repeat-containing protein [Candidatus Brocadiia bacterium]